MGGGEQSERLCFADQTGYHYPLKHDQRDRNSISVKVY